MEYKEALLSMRVNAKP